MAADSETGTDPTSFPPPVEQSDDFPYLIQLQTLKEMNDQQRLLSRTEGQLEICYDNYRECRALAERCSCELQKLREEKKELVGRLATIETDMSKLLDISKNLQVECAVQCSNAPVLEYGQQLASVNNIRQAAQLPPLEDCTAYQQLQCVGKSEKIEWKKKLVKHKLPKGTLSLKAGPSFKLCPACLHQVSRNAVSCSHCNSTCSKSSKTM